MWKVEFDPTTVAKEKAEKGDEPQRIGTVDKWYEVGFTHWNNQPATVDGVCGGYGVHHEMESGYSKDILKMHAGLLPGFSRALDGGAGIGRVTKSVLNEFFESIDLQEQSTTQFEQAKTFVPFVKK